MIEQDLSHADLLDAACGVLCILFVVRMFPAESLLKRAMFGCVLCLLAMVAIDASGDHAGARVRGAAGLPMAVAMGAAVLFAVLRLRWSR
jgi:hypothetical protein